MQRWRSENRGPRYIKLSKIVRYRLADILDYEQAQRQGEPFRNALPPLPSSAPAPEPAPDPGLPQPEPMRYTLKETLALIAQYGSLQAPEAALGKATAMNHDAAAAWVGQARRRSRHATREPEHEPEPRIIDIRYPILSEAALLHRWSLSPKALQRWSAEGIGPPAWRIGKHPRYLVYIGSRMIPNRL